MSDEDVERVWEEFWAPALAAGINEHSDHDFAVDDLAARIATASISRMPVVGPMLLAQIKRELFDWHSAMDVVSRVYCHATGGMLSKPNYSDVAQITAIIDEHYDEAHRAELAEALVDAREVFADTIAFGDDDTSIFGAVEAAFATIRERIGVSDEEMAQARQNRERLAAALAFNRLPEAGQ